MNNKPLSERERGASSHVEDEITDAMIAVGAAIIADAMFEASWPCPPSASDVAARVYKAMARLK
jgi:hypothetical protein